MKAANSPRNGKRNRAATGSAREGEKRTLAGRKYRKPIERVKRPAETTTFGAGILGAVVSGLGLNSAGVDTTTWLAASVGTAAVGIIPLLVSGSVDFFRERKEERQLRADLSERAVMAIEALAGIEPPEDLVEDLEDGSAEVEDDTPSILLDFVEFLSDRTRAAKAPVRAKGDGNKTRVKTEGEGDASEGKADRKVAGNARNKRTPAGKNTTERQRAAGAHVPTDQPG